MLLKIKVIVRDPNNSNKFVGRLLKINLKKLFKSSPTGRTRRFFTTLKSPHAHKDAQTSFELISYHYFLSLRCNQVSKFLSYYKRLLSRIVPDVKMHLILKVSKWSTFICKKKNVKSYFSKSSNTVLPNYLKRLSLFGKMSFFSV